MLYGFSLNYYCKSEKTDSFFYPFLNTSCTDSFNIKRTIEENGDIKKSEIVFNTKKNLEKPAGISIIFRKNGWQTDNYVFAPSALYNGNRFYSLSKQYPPMLTKEERERFNGETVISDIPRLAGDGSAVVQLNVGDLAVPCFGWFSKSEKKGYLLFFEQENELGNFGITICEDVHKKIADFILSSPCVREKYAYGMTTTKRESPDKGTPLKAGSTVTFRFSEHSFDCESVVEFHNRFFEYRAMQGLPRSHPNTVPWSYAWKTIEEKYNSRNWVEKPGFYKSSEATGSICSQWQLGWVGGAMNTLPAFELGNEESVEKSSKTLDFVFSQTQHSSGFLHGIYYNGTLYGDDINNPENKNIVMSRKNADALYYLAKQLMLLDKRGIQLKPLWKTGVKKLADAFLHFYRKNNDLGQFIDIEKGTPYVGKSASAGIAPAGMMLCADYFDNSEYKAMALELGEAYYRDYICKGYTNGGPGEILSAPDSESAFALLESYIVLYSHTNDKKWLSYAVDTASLCAGWCVSYDYRYGENTQLYSRGVSTTGAVWANVQNKHAAPGICTLSGSSLFRLYRATGDVRYLDLCRDIAHCITQFVSIPENPIFASYVWHEKKATLQKKLTKVFADFAFGFSKAMQKPVPKNFNPIGRINERVNLSDWEGANNIGEIPHGSCWCEVSEMLTYLEIPAVYVQNDTLFCYTLDHVQCCVEKNVNGVVLTITNPTEYDAQYRVFIEASVDCIKPLDDLFFTDFKSVPVKAHETKKIKL